MIMPTRTAVWSLVPSPKPPINRTPSLPSDVSDIVMTKNIPSAMYLTSWYALSFDHLPVLVDTECPSSLLQPSDHPHFRRTDWAKFQSHLEDKIPFDPELHIEMSIVTCAENFPGAVLEVLAASTPECRLHDNPRHQIPAGIQDDIRLNNRLRRRWQVTRDPALRA